ncbi:MAG: hypothetical protein LC624_07595 [Halobacteriales archaeon]|nr:hypothetical protein [Halobacteriales archaeon]
MKNFKGDGPLHLVLGFLWHIPKDLAMELPPHREAAARAEQADEAVAELAGLVVHASLYGPADAPHVFDRRFEDFVREHLHRDGAGPVPHRAPRSVPQRA